MSENSLEGENSLENALTNEMRKTEMTAFVLPPPNYSQSSSNSVQEIKVFAKKLTKEYLQSNYWMDFYYHLESFLGGESESIWNTVGNTGGRESYEKFSTGNGGNSNSLDVAAMISEMPGISLGNIGMAVNGEAADSLLQIGESIENEEIDELFEDGEDGDIHAEDSSETNCPSEDDEHSDPQCWNFAIDDESLIQIGDDFSTTATKRRWLTEYLSTSRRNSSPKLTPRNRRRTETSYNYIDNNEQNLVSQRIIPQKDLTNTQKEYVETLLQKMFRAYKELVLSNWFTGRNLIGRIMPPLKYQLPLKDVKQHCIRCPKGVDCNWGSFRHAKQNLGSNEAGYMVLSEDVRKGIRRAYRCLAFGRLRMSNCKGGLEIAAIRDTCPDNSGATGIACAVCDETFFWNGRRCAKCGSVSLSQNVYFLVVLFFCVVIILTYWFMLPVGDPSKFVIEDIHIRTIRIKFSTTVSLLLGNMQTY